MSKKLRVAVVGLGKMGLSHLSILRPDPRVEVIGVCDASKIVRDVLAKYTGVTTFSDAAEMVKETRPEAVVIATPTASHFPLARTALLSGASVFCEKPLTLSHSESAELTKIAEAKGLHGQVGYHNRFVGSFQEVKKLLDAGAIGRVVHVRAEAQGPVVLKAKGSTWRSKRDQGGGCLYDYAAHPMDLATWLLGRPESVAGTVLGHTFSTDTEDEVYSTVKFGDVSAQVSVNWSDESQRKMRTAITVWGTQGTIYADRQECRVYLRDKVTPPGYRQGWNMRYTTDLTEAVDFYVRGEEYSAQLRHFVTAALTRRDGGDMSSIQGSTFAEASETDALIEMLIRDDAQGKGTSRELSEAHIQAAALEKRGGIRGRLKRLVGK